MKSILKGMKDEGNDDEPAKPKSIERKAPKTLEDFC